VGHIRGLPNTREVLMFKTIALGIAADLPLDRHGRVLLPPRLRKFLTRSLTENTKAGSESYCTLAPAFTPPGNISAKVRISEERGGLIRAESLLGTDATRRETFSPQSCRRQLALSL
jgi:hypothetical protein